MTRCMVITGGGGFLGSSVAALFPEAHRPTRAEVDLTDAAAVSRYFAAVEPEVVLHLAARVGGITANMQAPADFLLENMRIDANVCAAVRTCKPTHFVPLVSTCMYPDRLADACYPMSEDLVEAGAPPPTNAAYAAGKRALWHAARALHDQYGIGFTCLAPTNIYGPGDHFGAVGNHFLAAAIARIYHARQTSAKAAQFFGTGVALRQVVYVRDVARVIEHFVAAGPANQLVNVASEQVHTIADLARAVARAADYRGDIVFSGQGPDGQYRKDVSTARLHRYMPAWSAQQTPLLRGLQDTLAWCDKRWQA